MFYGNVYLTYLEIIRIKYLKCYGSLFENWIVRSPYYATFAKNSISNPFFLLAMATRIVAAWKGW